MAVVVVVLVAIGGFVLVNRGDDGGSPTTQADLARILRDDRDLEPAVAACVAAQAYDRLTEDELDLLRTRGPDDELAPELRRKLEAAVAPCASAGS